MADMNGNYITARPSSNALMVANIIEDVTEPQIVSFDLDMNNGVLTIIFSETVDEDRLNTSRLWLQSEEFITNISVVYQLQDQQSIEWNLTIARITLLQSDLNAIKLLEDLAVSNDTVYLRFINTTVFDINNNALSPLNNATQGLAIDVFTPDTTQPELTAFSLDMNEGLLDLTFSEPVQSSSIDFTTITLQSSANSSTHDSLLYYTLTNGTVLSTNGLVIMTELDFIDFVNIQSRPMEATFNGNTYISLANGTALDIVLNPSSNISIEDAMLIEVDGYRRDETSPVLDTFSVNVDVGVISLTFSEAINASTVNPLNFIIQREQDDRNLQPDIRLTGSSVSIDNWYIINLTLTFDLLNSIKLEAVNYLLVNESTSYISISSDSALDMVNRAVEPVNELNAIPASGYTPDTTEPVLESFNLTIVDSGNLTLCFSEPVRYDSFNATNIEFHNANHTNLSTETVLLTGGNPMTMENGLNLVFMLSTDDLNTIKRMLDLVTDDNNTYIYLYTGAVVDMYFNDIDLQDGYTVPVNSFVPDNTNPSLDAFELDMNTGVLTLNFSETVNSSTFDVTGVTLQSSESRALYEFTLTDGEHSTTDDPTITINLTVSDLNEIKRIRGLATDVDNTYISLTSDVVYDTSGFSLTEITTEQARKAGLHVPDTTSPILLEFSLNISSDELSLTFDETVSAGDVIPNRITVMSSDVNETFVTLTNSSSVILNDSTVIIVALGMRDLDRIKLDTGLAVDNSTTRLLIVNETVLDMAGNPTNEQDLNVSIFYPDLVSPSLNAFVFDLNTGLVILHFDEAVNVNTLNISALSFLNKENGTIIYKLTNATTNSTNGYRLQLYLRNDDLNDIKANESLLTSMIKTHGSESRGQVK